MYSESDSSAAAGDSAVDTEVALLGSGDRVSGLTG